MSSILVWNYDNAVVYTFGRYSLHMKIVSQSIILKKSIIFTLFYQFKPKHSFAYLQYVLYSSADSLGRSTLYIGRYSLDTKSNIFKDFIKFHESTKFCHFCNFSSMQTKLRRCTPSTCALSICRLTTTLQCRL